MGKLDRIREKIAANEPVVGTAVALTDSSVVDLLGNVGFDFLWIDSEHAAFGRKHILNHIIAAQGAGAAAFVRVPWNDPVLVKPILDMGPDAIIFPRVNTADEDSLRRAGIYGRGVNIILEKRPFADIQSFGDTPYIGEKSIRSALEASSP